ncbi:CHASE2 domain-containing protein [Leptothoe kymatousa]|uniref:CHASE2 domain-containing protein n=1 Tax=Leptothoe kymatousa TAU-MAC 1615 TaxID=2364775 RepID=A0ABS5Y7A6_9CYAN|nr:CHASE2 domain-containing protein [Leptothoe kymatousa]MBT9313656.1 CHASE2 domain-containing protein [Leptothoe kymatousa TAU-MAC 1615]
MYQVGGSLSSDAQSYVCRAADDELYNALIQRQFCYILTARQMGKSSLRVRTMARLQQAGIRCGLLDMTMLGTHEISQDQWYASLVRRLIRTFRLPTQFRAWWQERQCLSPVQRLAEFLDDELLGHIEAPIVLFMDEIDVLLQLGFVTDDFFALLRACYNNRADNPAYKRLTIALVGVAVPGDLIKDPVTTPFNVGRAVTLHGLQREDCCPLVQGLQTLVNNPDETVHHILAWTGGQPFLTQKLCQLVGRSAANLGEAITVDLLVQKHIIDNWEAQDQPEHLGTIRDRILYNPVLAGRVLGIYQQLLQGEDIATDDSEPQLVLRLSGLVIDAQGRLAIANPIYQAVFDQRWVAQQLDALRPYGPTFEQWLAAGGQTQEHLLKGLELQAALAWADTKQLSDADYRFLAASQAAEKNQVEATLAQEIEERERAEFALAAATEATQVLAHSRRQARKHATRPRNMAGWIAGAAMGATALVGAVRIFGGLQNLELAMLDRYFRWRPTETIEPRVVVVTIDEPDIQTIGQFPIPDAILAKALKTIDSYGPRLIGLDMYRDLPVEPGHGDLLATLEQLPNLMAIEKVMGTPIAGPPVLQGSERLGFADQTLDNDGTVRRALLSMSADGVTAADDGSDVIFSFPLKLSLAYLAADGINSVALPENPSYQQLGRTVIKPLIRNHGGYTRAEMGGYQVLLNYAGNLPTVSITDVLTDQVDPDTIRDRIVLVGSSASTVNDLLLTPYTQTDNGYMPGVTVHAHTITMVLSAALDGRPLIRTYRRQWDWLWILLWATGGALVAARWQHQPGIVLALTTISVGGLVAVTYGAFLWGWWVAVVPPALGYIMGVVAIPVVTARQLDRRILRQVMADLVTVAQEKPAVGKIAIAYLKQAENTETQTLINTYEHEILSSFTSRHENNGRDQQLNPPGHTSNHSRSTTEP